MKILIGHEGLRGDLAINIPAIEYLKSRYPDAQIDMPIHKRFADMLPLFANQFAFNPVILDGYDDFPTAKDQEFFALREYDHRFHPMQPHRIDRWHDKMHQTSAVAYDYLGMTLSESAQQINLYRWFDVTPLKRTVFFAPFAGFESNPFNDKMLTVSRAQAIVDYIVGLGYHVAHMGGPGEPFLWNVSLMRGGYFESVREMLGSSLLLHTDTGAGWVASGYKHPQLGLYGHRYYGADKVCNIQPRNPNATYLDAPNVNEIPLETIFVAIKERLS